MAPCNISVVVQGPICAEATPDYPKGITYHLMQNLARLLPGAQLILSTWQGAVVCPLPEETLVVLSEDPGSQGGRPGLVSSNVNRQLVSTRAGLARAVKPYTLKIRTDVVLTDTRFLGIYVRAVATLAGYRSPIFSAPVLCNNLSSRNAQACPTAFVFHPSDHVQFGRTADIRALWAGALQTQADAHWFEEHPRSDHLRDLELSRLTPEQHIWTGALLAAGVTVPNFEYGSRSDELIKLSEDLLRSFVFVPDHQFSIHFPKYHTWRHAAYEYFRRNSMHALGRFDWGHAAYCGALRRSLGMVRQCRRIARAARLLIGAPT